MSAIGAVSAQHHTATAPQPRLVQAAHEFEAQLMKELLKPMMNGTGPDGEEADPGSGGALADFATDALGQALSKHGGLGIATNIIHSLSRSEENAQSFSNAGTGGMTLPSAGGSALKSSSQLPISRLRRFAHGNSEER
jgi:Rod binding domain-containing protein